MGFLRSLFGSKVPGASADVVSAAAVPASISPVSVSSSEYTEVPEQRFFEILETYQNRTRPLNDYVTWDVNEADRLKRRRIEAYQLANGTEYQPHDVFHLWPYRAVDASHVIKRVALKPDAPKSLPEFSQVMQVNVVSDRLMKAITALEEPARHAFYPLEIVSVDGGIRDRYHFLQFLEHTDCTVPKLGGFRRGVRQDGTTYWVRNSGDEKVFLDAERVGTRHLFYDKRAKSGCFISAELSAKLGDFLPRGFYLADVGLARKEA